MIVCSSSGRWDNFPAACMLSPRIAAVFHTLSENVFHLFFSHLWKNFLNFSPARWLFCWKKDRVIWKVLLPTPFARSRRDFFRVSCEFSTGFCTGCDKVAFFTFNLPYPADLRVFLHIIICCYMQPGFSVVFVFFIRRMTETVTTNRLPAPSWICFAADRLLSAAFWASRGILHAPKGTNRAP